MTAALELLAGVDLLVDPPALPVIEVDPPDLDAIDVVVVPGPRGPRGPAGDGGITHVQGQPMATWIIEHGLGRYPASVTVVVADTEITTDVLYPDVGTVTIVFSEPTAGRAEII